MARADPATRDEPQYQAAMVKSASIDRAELAQRAALHVTDAIATIVHLMKHASRPGVRLKAAVTLIEWAAAVEPDHDTRTKVYVLATDSTAEMAKRLRNRLVEGGERDPP